MIDLLVIRRKIIRQLLKFFCFNNYKNKSEYWPWVNIKVSPIMTHDIFSMTSHLLSTIPIKSLKTSKKNISIIGSGPSIKEQNLSKLKNTEVILLNGAITLIETAKIKPLCIIIIDSSFVEKRFDLIRKIPKGTNLIVTLGVIRAIQERSTNILPRLNIFITKNITTNDYDTRNGTEEEKAKKKGFSTNLDYGFINGGTVMSVAIQLAAQLNAKKIFLLGLDISNSDQPRFYESNNTALKSGLLKDYEQKILPFMIKARDVCMQEKIAIYNCSPISKLPYEIIPFFDLNNLS